MKAIIMAGGEGTRLRPISCLRPKPMTPLLDVPVLEHVITLLKKCGVTDICLTLRCMPDSIISFFDGRERELGVNLFPKIETETLGTAGSVRSCADFIGGEDFIVISGDAICDFDLTSCIDFHRKNNAEATLVLYSHPEPTEFGLVLTAPDGRIVRFFEKPGWDNVITDLVNTGVYILSPKILSLIPEKGEYDFGKDLFPKMLTSGSGLYGVRADGYWCDIGTPESFLSCSMDALDGKIKITRRAPEILPGVWCASHVPDDAHLIPPVYIGEKCVIEPGAKIGPHTVIGSHSRICSGAEITDSVLLGSFVGKSTEVHGAVVCSGAEICRNAKVNGQCVIGDGVQVGETAVVSGTSHIWPDAVIRPGSVVRGNVAAKGNREPVFSRDGSISGSPGAVITPELCLRLGAAAGSQGCVGICHDGSDAAKLFASCLSCGASAAGGNVFEIDCSGLSRAGWTGSTLALRYTIFVSLEHGNVRLTFFGKNGAPLSHDDERKLLSRRELPDGSGAFGSIKVVSGTDQMYFTEILRVSSGAQHFPLRIAVHGDGDTAELISLLSSLGCIISPDSHSTACFYPAHGGMSVTAVTERGEKLSWEKLQIIAAMIEFESGTKEIHVPEDASPSFEKLAEKCGGKVFRPDFSRSAHFITPSLRDGMFCTAKICSFMMEHGGSLDQLAAKSPSPYHFAKEVPLDCDRGRIMRLLGENCSGVFDRGCAGLRIDTGRGWVSIRPSREKLAVMIRSESGDAEIARELCTEFETLTKKLASGKNDKPGL